MLAPIQREWLGEIVETYQAALSRAWPTMLGFALLGVVVGAALLAWRARGDDPRAARPWLRALPSVVALGLVGLGLALALRRAACFDDAYISFRYAENLVAGEGLVYNPGERVEGYTNFAWTLLLAGLHALVPVETPLLAIAACLLAFAANLLVVWRIGLELAPPDSPLRGLPLALGLLATQNTFVDYGTSGLETGFASLLVDLGVWALIRPPSVRTRFAAGLCWILATLTRPDHALFYAVGSLVVLGIDLPGLVRALRGRASAGELGRALAPMLAYAAPFALWLAHAAWKLGYYGELLPNTYYAKSAELAYWAQGQVYALEFHLGSHLWLALIVLTFALLHARPTPGPGRRLVAFAVPVIVAYELYVMRIGGDFMAGRFYVSLIPLILLLGELGVHELAKQSAARWPALLALALLASTAGGVRMIPPRTERWYLTDESTYYPIARWSPIAIDHGNYHVGVALGRLRAAGIEPVIASGAIGLIGYYSGLRVVDRLGLIDPVVAHQALESRGRPGHEKWATSEHLRARGVHFVRGGPYPEWFAEQGTIRWGVGGRSWWVFRYDPAMMAAIREVAPNVRFRDLPTWLDRRARKLRRVPRDQLEREYAFLRTLYFDEYGDLERERAYREALRLDVRTP